MNQSQLQLSLKGLRVAETDALNTTSLFSDTSTLHPQASKGVEQRENKTRVDDAREWLDSAPPRGRSRRRGRHHRSAPRETREGQPAWGRTHQRRSRQRHRRL